jgi:hypothetical protein
LSITLTTNGTASPKTNSTGTGSCRPGRQVQVTVEGDLPAGVAAGVAVDRHVQERLLRVEVDGVRALVPLEAREPNDALERGDLLRRAELGSIADVGVAGSPTCWPGTASITGRSLKLGGEWPGEPPPSEAPRAMTLRTSRS